MDSIAVEEQPARPPVGAENKCETLQQDKTKVHVESKSTSYLR